MNTQAQVQVDETVAMFIDFTSYDVPKSDVVDHSMYSTKSAKIRYLNSIGWSRKQIADELNIRYQHVRNVLVTQLTGK